MEQTTSPEFDYIRVEVTRPQSTELYLKVPKGWMLGRRDRKLLGIAAKETTDDSDWDSWEWEKTVEIQSSRACTKEEAERYHVCEVTTAGIPIIGETG